MERRTNPEYPPAAPYAIWGLLITLTSAAGNTQLESLVEEALRNNPGLKAAAYQVEGANAARNGRRSLDPPQLGVEFFQAPISSFPNPLDRQMEIDYSVQQMIPFPGKRGAMVRAEGLRADMLGREGESRRNSLIRDLKQRYYMLIFLNARAKINAENRDWVNRLLGIARRQYEVGMGSQPDILRAQTELAVVTNEGITITQERKTMEGMINALLNRPVDRPFDSLDAAAMPDSLPWDFAQLAGFAALHPELQAMEAGARMADAEVAAARKEFWPDFMVRGMYKDMLRGEHGEPEDNWAVMVGMDVPLAPWSLGGRRSALARGRADLKRAEQEAQEMRNMRMARLREALLGVESGWNLLQLARGSQVPQAEQALQSALSAYQTGRTEFLMLLDAYKMSRMARLDYQMAIMKLMQSRADLEEAVGMSLGEIEQRISLGSKEER